MNLSTLGGGWLRSARYQGFGSDSSIFLNSSISLKKRSQLGFEPDQSACDSNDTGAIRRRENVLSRYLSHRSQPFQKHCSEPYPML